MVREAFQLAALCALAFVARSLLLCSIKRRCNGQPTLELPSSRWDAHLKAVPSEQPCSEVAPAPGCGGGHTLSQRNTRIKGARSGLETALL